MQTILTDTKLGNRSTRKRKRKEKNETAYGEETSILSKWLKFRSCPPLNFGTLQSSIAENDICLMLLEALKQFLLIHFKVSVG